MASFCSCFMDGDGSGMIDTNSNKSSTFSVISVIFESLAECITCTGNNAEVSVVFNFNYHISHLSSFCIFNFSPNSSELLLSHLTWILSWICQEWNWPLPAFCYPWFSNYSGTTASEAHYYFASFLSIIRKMWCWNSIKLWASKRKGFPCNYFAKLGMWYGSRRIGHCSAAWSIQREVSLGYWMCSRCILVFQTYGWNGISLFEFPCSKVQWLSRIGHCNAFSLYFLVW